MKPAKKTRKVQTNKTNYMSDEAFADLKEAMDEALALEQMLLAVKSVRTLQGGNWRGAN